MLRTVRRAKIFRWIRRLLVTLFFLYTLWGVVADVLRAHWVSVAVTVPLLVVLLVVWQVMRGLFLRDLDKAVRLANVLKGMAEETVFITADRQFVFYIPRSRPGIFAVRALYSPGSQQVLRFALDDVNGAMSDFNLGQIVSSLPYRQYSAIPSQGVAAFDHSQQLDWDAEQHDAVIPDLPGGVFGAVRQVWSNFRVARFANRVGVMRPTSEELEETIALLKDATPLEDDDDGDR